MAEIFSKAWPIALAVLFFGLIVMVHECGHFLTAKLFKVKVHKFALGMGPRILKWGKGETEYSLRLFPIGGFVMMEGEDEESDDERAFNKKPAWQRMIILAAGAIMNLLLGLIVVCVMLTIGDSIGSRQVVEFTQDAQSYEAGLREGDLITKINGKPVFSVNDIGFLMARESSGQYDFVVKRGGEKVAINGVKLPVTEEDGHPSIHYDFWVGKIKRENITPKLVAEGTFRQSASLVQMTYLSLFDLVTGHFHLSDMSGPIGIAGTIADVASQTQVDPDTGRIDLTMLLTILALITINIGIMNLLPLPALDGGRLFFLLINWISPKKIPQKYEGWVHAAGLVALLGFMVVVSFGDIMKLIQR
ncbi:MAG: site-2 protease family protein [Oscillospiraceae bacterium]|jgi:regulator of sigma E protease|nr:site-2 protease family protein [Oscillospiraceae bacterium]